MAWPTSVATDADLYLAVNNLSTVLTDNPLTAGATTVNVSDASSFPTTGILTIDLEAIHYTGTTATSFTGCTRGFDGTTAASHAVNSTVFHDIPAAHHNVIKDEIIAIENYLDVALNKTNDGTVGAPAYSFESQTTMGMYRSTGNLLGLTSTGSRGILIDGSNSLQINDGTAATPGIRFADDTDTGMWRSAANVLNLGTNGAAAITIDDAQKVLFVDGAAATPSITFGSATTTGFSTRATDVITVSNGGATTAEFFTVGLSMGTGKQFELDSGSVGTPGMGFTGAASGKGNLGIYSSADNTMALVTQGTERIELSFGSINMKARTFYPDGSAASPSISFTNYNTTGFSARAANVLSASANGVLQQEWFDTGGGFSQFSGTHVRFPVGSASAPSLTFTGDLDTGIYRAAANQINITTNGSESFHVSSGLARFSDGTAAFPGLAFISDTNTGIYRTGADQLGLAVNGANRLNITTSEVSLGNGGGNFIQADYSTPQMLPRPDNTWDLGNGTFRWAEVFAAIGSINTSHSTTKYDIKDLEDLEVPKAVRFKRKDDTAHREGREYIGYLNDSLPDTARPKDKNGEVYGTQNYDQAVVGILCNAVRKLQAEIKELKNGR